MLALVCPFLPLYLVESKYFQEHSKKRSNDFNHPLSPDLQWRIVCECSIISIQEYGLVSTKKYVTKERMHNVRAMPL